MLQSGALDHCATLYPFETVCQKGQSLWKQSDNKKNTARTWPVFS